MELDLEIMPGSKRWLLPGGGWLRFLRGGGSQALTAYSSNWPGGRFWPFSNRFFVSDAFLSGMHIAGLEALPAAFAVGIGGAFGQKGFVRGGAGQTPALQDGSHRKFSHNSQGLKRQTAGG